MADSAMVAAAAISVRAMIAPLLIGVAVDGQLRPGTQTSALPTVAPVPLPFRSGAPAAKSISVRAHVDVEAVARVEPVPEVGLVAAPAGERSEQQQRDQRSQAVDSATSSQGSQHFAPCRLCMPREVCTRRQRGGQGLK
jgi:hypothetical protein